jgi:hypothetical protein
MVQACDLGPSWSSCCVDSQSTAIQIKETSEIIYEKRQEQAKNKALVPNSISIYLYWNHLLFPYN